MFKAPNYELYLPLRSLAGINLRAMTQTLHLFLILVGLLSFDATAQWAWTDQEGRQVFSDRAPSVNVPDKRIFKRPGENASVNSQDVSANAPTLSNASGPQVSGIDKELAERVKKAAQAQAVQHKAEAERISQLKADNCQRARLAQKTIDSGARLSQINIRGEREVMNDASRTAEAKRIQSIIDSDCN